MKDIKAKILSNTKIAAGYFKLTLDAPFIARSVNPGQFVMVRCSDGSDPLLRRPLGIHRVAGIGSRVSGIEILYEVVGKGTEILSKKKQEDFIGVLGPLGNGFELPRTSSLGHQAILVAGGIGVAPLFFLGEELTRKNVKTTVLIGAKTKKLILCEKDFKKIGAEVHITTDDGTCGCKGLVSELLKKVLRTTGDGRETRVYSCGPRPMLQCIAGICKEEQVECQISLEEIMACGIGACLGCAVKIKVKRKFIQRLACKDGPVFNTGELVW